MQLSHVVIALALGGVDAQMPGKVVINEVSDSGSTGVCGGSDWIELVNIGDSSLDISSYMLCDSKGCSDPDAYTFPEGSVVAAGAYKLLCRGAAPDGFEFGIGKDDKIKLQDTMGQAADSAALESQGGPDITWARIPDGTGDFFYTWSPTPGEPNVYKPRQDLKNCGSYGLLDTGDKCEAPWESLAPGSKYPLLPTESSVGHAWVYRQYHDDFETLEDASAWMSSHEFPVVLHNNAFYLTDRHHHALALEISGYGPQVKIILKVICNFNNLAPERFWTEMVDKKYALAADWSDDSPYDLPIAVDFSKMPKSWQLEDYGDNSWRSLAGFSSHHEPDENRCYVKSCDYFIDFGWAYLYNAAAIGTSKVWPADAPSSGEEFLTALRELPRRFSPHEYDAAAWQKVADMLLPLCHSPDVENFPLPSFFPQSTLQGWALVPLPDDPHCVSNICAVGSNSDSQIIV